MPKDHILHKTSNVAKHPLHHALAVAISQTDRLFLAWKPDYGFYVAGLEHYAHTLAGVVSIGAMIARNSIGMISATTITVHSTPEQLAMTACKAFIDETLVEKSAATGLTFNAAHVVAAGKYGVIALQMDKAGDISSKVPSATQTYVTAGQAVAALPAADAGEIVVGYLVIQAKSGSAWTANTDDLTAASDLETLTIVNTAAITRMVTGSALVTKARTKASITSESARRGGYNDTLLLVYTSDGSAALTNGSVTAQVRPAPMGGEY